jgi:pyridoxal biosynthesis lyase PdxS
VYHFLKTPVKEFQEKSIALIVAQGVTTTAAEALRIIQAKDDIFNRNGFAFDILTTSLSDTVAQAILFSLTNYDEPDCVALYLRTQHGSRKNQRQAKLWQAVWGRPPRSRP